MASAINARMAVPFPDREGIVMETAASGAPTSVLRTPRGVPLPRIIFGISALGNLYRALPPEDKRAIVGGALAGSPGTVVFDGAGKYGAGLALECLGEALLHHSADPRRVVISNKLAWRRTPLRGPEPTFEPGVWAGLGHDAVQDISAEGILRCRAEGLALLGAPWTTQLVSVHDPDEYLAAARGAAERDRRLADVVGAYGSLIGLRERGEVAAVGIGAKDWRVAREIVEYVDVDWVMLACSLTVMRHPPELLAWIAELADRGVQVVNSAVFHGGFLTGGRFFDYREVDPATAEGAALCGWRERFTATCRRHGVTPATACVAFGFLVPGVASVALNTSEPRRMAENLALGHAEVPAALWWDLAGAGLIDPGFRALP